MADLDIKLNMKNKPPGNGQWPPNGFTECKNNGNYAYRYVGGNFDNGRGFAFAVTSSPQDKTVEVKVIGAGTHSYEINSVTLTYDDPQPAEKDVTESYAGDTATFEDNVKTPQSGSFTVFVNDTSVSPNVTNIECDPRWQNR